MTASMAHDLQRGNRLEVEWLSGGVAQLGAGAGVPTRPTARCGTSSRCTLKGESPREPATADAARGARARRERADEAAGWAPALER